MIDDDGLPGGRKTVARADLVEVVHAKIGLPRNECSELVETVLSLICDAAVRGENIDFFRHLGRLLSVKKPKEWDVIQKPVSRCRIASRRVMTFRPSQVLRAKVDGDGMEGDS